MTTSPTSMINVRSMISIFENQSYTVNNEPTRLKARTKSMENLSANRPKKTAEPHAPKKNLELVQIEQQVRHLQKTLNNYKTYSRDSHISYQNQIFFLLTDLVNVETRNDPNVIDKKSELIEETKRLNKALNSRLPSEARKSQNFSFVQASKPADEKVKTPKKEKQEEVVRVVKEQVGVIEEPEEETPTLSVKTLKQIFERNISQNETVRKETPTKITRKFTTFNGSTDIKYIPYSERLKSKEAEFQREYDVQISNGFFEKSVVLTHKNEDKVEDEEEEEPKSVSIHSSSGEDSDESSNAGSGDDEENRKSEESS